MIIPEMNLLTIPTPEDIVIESGSGGPGWRRRREFHGGIQSPKIRGFSRAREKLAGGADHDELEMEKRREREIEGEENGGCGMIMAVEEEEGLKKAESFSWATLCGSFFSLLYFFKIPNSKFQI